MNVILSLPSTFSLIMPTFDPFLEAGPIVLIDSSGSAGSYYPMILQVES